MGEAKILQPRARTTTAAVVERTKTGRLPDELLDEQIQRFGVFTAIGGGLWTYGLLMDTFIVPRTVGAARGPALGPELFGIVASVLAFLYVRYAPHGAQTKSNGALVYMLMNAMAVALMNTRALPNINPTDHLSWNTIVILVSSMIMPTTPLKMFLASVAAATTDPLAVWLAHLRGVPVPSMLNTFVMFMPNYACAVVATVPPYALRNIGRRLREAQELGSYQLIELLGQGGMGEVWRAKHRLLARPAAIKLVRPELLGAGNEAEARTMVRRFEREAQATATLSSPHTIRIFDFGATREGTFYYVMELLSGRDLDSLVREFGPLSADRVVYLLRQVCHSLADAHARGMVHRDVKPANIYVCRMGLEYDFVKVLDFGLVKVRSEEALQTVTSDHTTSGTPAFMAPEIILGERNIDQCADVYALGCVAYYLLTGELVFEADTPMKMFLQHVQTPPIPPSQRTELPIPKELDDLVLACLEKDPRRRPQNAEHLFRMTCRCRSGDSWDNDAAKAWWEMHLLELTGPLTATEISAEGGPSPVVIH